MQYIALTKRSILFRPFDTGSESGSSMHTPSGHLFAEDHTLHVPDHDAHAIHVHGNLVQQHLDMCLSGVRTSLEASGFPSKCDSGLGFVVVQGEHKEWSIDGRQEMQVGLCCNPFSIIPVAQKHNLKHKLFVKFSP